ncbi:MAG: nucleotidyltransferase domain-containing protein [Spirochaetaceae bacterium]|nr:nucleotidyltransferase domain-containing protein [Spirochaetaceae bacterium]
MNEAEEIKKKLSEYFSQNEKIDTVLLFGSFSKGTFNENSDIDIAVHSQLPLDYETLSTIQTELSLLCHREIDLSDLAQAEGIFLYQIMTTGVKIKIKPTVFVKYLTKALCFKEDFLPAIEYIRREKIRRFVNG